MKIFSLFRSTEGENDDVKVKPKQAHPHQKTTAPRRLNWFSKIYCCWIWKILRKGKKDGLEESDIPPLPDVNSCRIVGGQLVAAWERRRQQDGGKPILWRLLLRLYWKEILAQGIMFLFSQGLQIWRSLLLGFFLDTYALSPKWILTRILAVGLVLTSALNVLTINPWNFLGSELGMNMCSALTALLYHKSLHLSARGLCETDQGQLTNLVSNDVKRLETRIGVLHALWVGPLVTMTAFLIMWLKFDPASAIGLLVLAVVVALSSSASVKSSKILQKIGALRDARLKIIDEITTNIRQIKTYCWEKVFEEKIEEIRRNEVRNLKTRWKFWALHRNLYVISPRVIVFVALFASLVSVGTLNPGTAFVIMCLYNTVTSIMSQGFPSAFFLATELNVTLRRCQDFLSLDECGSKEKTGPLRERIGQVFFKNFSGKRPGKEKRVLQNITLKVLSGKPAIILGGVGSGKSTLFDAILGEVEAVTGFVKVRGGVAILPQNPWTFPATLRENIVFGNQFNRHWYQLVLDACALTQDIKTFPLGDTEVLGDKGITLSGGQRSRVCLARALYADAEVYLIDNVLGAVDVTVGAHILNNVIFGLLRFKCVLMTTNSQLQMNALMQTFSVLMENGKIVKRGKYSELCGKLDLLQSMTDRGFESGNLCKPLQTTTEKVENESFPSESKDFDKASNNVDATLDGMTVLFNCIRNAGQGRYAAFSVILLIFFQFLQSSGDVMMTKWTNESYSKKGQKGNSTMIYFALISLNVAVGLIGLSLFYRVCAMTGAEIHTRAIGALIRSKLKFFSGTTTGSILNRFSMDMSTIEEYLPKVIEAALFSVLQVTGIFGVVVGLNEMLGVAVVIVGFLFFRLRGYYLRSSADLRLLEVTARGPVYTLVNSTLDGLSTIRSLGQEEHFKAKLCALKDKHTATYLALLTAFNWFILWTDLLVILFSAIAVVISLEFTKDTAVAGLTLSLIFSVDNMLSYGLQQTADLDNELVSVKRMVEYSELESEFKGDATVEDCPRSGNGGGGVAIEFKDVTAAYVPGVPVLKGINCAIYEGEKVGIVGRTGSGKTSFLGCILRLVDISSGEVNVDGMDVNEVRLHELRSHISVISQTPALVEGTLRYNLDVDSEFSDEELWDVLTAVQLKERVESGGLQLSVATGGSNFSHGERQLLSLARAMLKKNTILLIDELTANIDKKTEDAIENVISQRFGHCTIVSVAHNLAAVINCHTICVLDEGEIKEWDSPQRLLQDKKSMLSQLVQQWLGSVDQFSQNDIG